MEPSEKRIAEIIALIKADMPTLVLPDPEPQEDDFPANVVNIDAARDWRGIPDIRDVTVDELSILYDRGQRAKPGDHLYVPRETVLAMVAEIGRRRWTQHTRPA